MVYSTAAQVLEARGILVTGGLARSAVHRRDHDVSVFEAHRYSRRFTLLGAVAQRLEFGGGDRYLDQHVSVMQERMNISSCVCILTRAHLGDDDIGGTETKIAGNAWLEYPCFLQQDDVWAIDDHGQPLLELLTLLAVGATVRLEHCYSGVKRVRRLAGEHTISAAGAAVCR